MKRLILIIILLAPVNAFANSCWAFSGDSLESDYIDYIAVRYTIWNQSRYEIGLKFDEAVHGDNPDYDQYLRPHSDPVTEYGCSNGLFTGYETKATLVMHDLKSGVYFDLSYLYIDNPFFGAGSFSYVNSFPYEAYYLLMCSCQVRVGTGRLDMDYTNCADYKGSMKRRVDIIIGCR